MSIREAWEFYGIRNGAETLVTLQRLISRNWKSTAGPDDEIGCTILSEPFFLEEPERISVPEDWARQAVSGKYYSLADPIGARLYSCISTSVFRRTHKCRPLAA